VHRHKTSGMSTFTIDFNPIFSKDRLMYGMQGCRCHSLRLPVGFASLNESKYPRFAHSLSIEVLQFAKLQRLVRLHCYLKRPKVGLCTWHTSASHFHVDMRKHMFHPIRDKASLSDLVARYRQKCQQINVAVSKATMIWTSMSPFDLSKMKYVVLFLIW
jgi:hypothetical protein